MNRLLWNIGTTYLARFLTIAIEFVMFPFIASQLGMSAFGALLIIDNALSLFLQSDLGVGASTVRYAAHSHATNKGEEFSRILSTSIVFYAVVGLMAALAFILAMHSFWGSFGQDISSDSMMTVIVIASVGNLLIGLPLTAFRNTLIGFQRYDLFNIVQVIQSVTKAILVVILLRSGLGMKGVVIADALGILLSGIVAIKLFFDRSEGISISIRNASIATLKEILPYSLQISAIGLLGFVILETDNIVVGAVVSMAMVAVYAAAFRLYMGVRELTGAFVRPFMPDAARSHVLGERSRLSSLLVVGTRAMNCVTLLAVVPVAFFADDLLRIWAGESFVAGAWTLRILLVGLVLNNNHLISTALMKGIGTLGAFLRYHLVWAVGNLALSIPLGASYGIVGVAIGTTLPLFFLEPFYIRTTLKEIPASIGAFLGRSMLLPLLVSIASFIPMALIESRLDSMTIFSIAALSCLYGTVFVLVAWMVVLAPSERRSITSYLNSARSRISRRILVDV